MSSDLNLVVHIQILRLTKDACGVLRRKELYHVLDRVVALALRLLTGHVVIFIPSIGIILFFCVGRGTPLEVVFDLFLHGVVALLYARLDHRGLLLSL